ncbi:nuclear transport factor 2 family protein [Natronomonas sp. F2-12]|jgi:hypothetical protein|uniref:Nuclear transport factor 2 family protein n=1 Tax=Natronomonas aquatica TaxID=2841590 RepID=A0A9R1CRJ1_9EURY|nr:nuclear transport factor 2 family protein [Natronomonas aquatica]MCQ4332532.1 nuclear transport factor 2 family protein [Natronomonas aquatica]
MTEVDNEAIQEVIDKFAIHELMSEYEMMYDHFPLPHGGGTGDFNAFDELDNIDIEDHVDDFMELFTDDCVVDYGIHGRIEGKKALRDFQLAYFKKETEFVDWFHLVANPWIEVHDNEARGKWNFFGPYIMEGAGACFHFSTYDNTFVKDDGEWKIENLKLTLKYMSPYDGGWEDVPIDDVFLSGDSM